MTDIKHELFLKSLKEVNSYCNDLTTMIILNRKYNYNKQIIRIMTYHLKKKQIKIEKLNSMMK